MIITIQRRLGSGGRLAGQLVAKRLGIPYVDRKALLQAAKEAKLSEEDFQSDERRPSFLQRLTDLAIKVHSSPGSFDTRLPESGWTPETGWDQYRRLVEQTMRELAERGSAVIIGRGGHIVLKDERRALHVYTYAPEELRIKRLAEREGISLAQASEMVKHSDEEFEGYMKAGYDVDWNDPAHYDLVINSVDYSVEAIAEVILKAAEVKSAHVQVF